MAENAPPSSSSSSPQLPSRYKSQRRKQASVDDARASDQYVSSPGDDGVTRSKSRYHHKPGHSSDPHSSFHRPMSKQQSDSPSRYRSSQRDSPSKPLYQEHIVQANPIRKDDGYGSPPPKPTIREPRSYTSNQPSSDGLRQQYNSRETQQVRNTESRSASNLPSASPPATVPTGELFPPPRPIESKKLKDGPPQSGNIRATRSMSHLPVFEGDEDAGCFGGLFRRKRSDIQPMEEPKKVPLPPTMSNGERPAIMAGGGGIVPGTDAPVSAVNAGDRYVLVECGKSHALFPFTPTTTPTDIIKSAATCLSECINVKSAVLLENFSTVGIQRPLRRYEHIRDVMNSWDHDKQNSLILINPGTGSLEPELNLAGAPKFEPEEQSWPLFYSQKVGKWDKRFIVLRSNGQIICQKDADKPKDAINVCHLSDFDIYAPTPEKLKKKIKPPKRYCLAIKSQQKTSLFESTENFVHFFATADRQTSDDFYNAVQAWRSWYLVNVMGEGKKEKEKPVVKTAELRDHSASNEHSKHRPQESMDSHYQLGSFKPLMDSSQFQRTNAPGVDAGRPGSSGGFAKSANQFDVNVSPERRISTRKKLQNPPVSLNNRAQLAEDEPLANLNRTTSVNKGRASTDQKRPDPSEFKDTSLLGRQYSQRRKETAERDAQRQEPFTTGSTLVNGGAEFGQTLAGDGLRRQPSTRAQTSSGDMKRTTSTRDKNGQRGGSIDLDRSTSRRQKPKPLVDLTPQYREPPQHSKKGRGFNPASVGAGGLIANATSPDDPLGLPQNHVFRNAGSGQHSGNGLVDVTPQHREPVQHARKGRGVQSGEAGGLVGNATSLDNNVGYRNANSGSADPSDAFTGEGLLAASSNRQGWGGNSKGRGVSGGGNGKPLVDFSADNKFAQGTLLGNVERKESVVAAPVIDREKRD